MSNNEFNIWLAEAAQLLGLDEQALSLNKELLDLTKEVAHNRARPAAPLTAFLVGLASASPKEARENIAKLMEALASEQA